jgi:acyl carrier protein
MQAAIQLAATEIRQIVFETIREVAGEHDKTLPELTDAVPLFESGLDSLCIAVIVARLEDRLGADPFAAEDGAELPVTVGDFAALYTHAVR